MNTEQPIILNINQLSMHFGGIAALTDINLDIPDGKITSIIGPNGAGKTTLFNCITGFYQAGAGHIYFKASNKRISLGKLLGQPFKLGHLVHPIQGLETLYYKMFGGSYRVARLGIARTFQNIRLFKEMSVIENILVAQHLQMNRNVFSGLVNSKSYKQNLAQTTAKAYEWLDLFALSDEANRLAGELPYGKQRRLEIARSLSTNPKLICLDEPAAGLNPSETAELSELIVQLKQQHDLTVLLIEHDMSMVMKISDGITVLDHGQIISQGTPDQIANDPKVIEAYLGVSEPSQGDSHASATAS